MLARLRRVFLAEFWEERSPSRGLFHEVVNELGYRGDWYEPTPTGLDRLDFA
ncbi:negative regulator of genetic competence, sporulation and motility [Thermocatellispora tengchongensis]|uniref:Negative regulator of genetic competence, sporulation and motility n=1 Tax=Thermocatellispora tengchongensis TaxID=1073253 RepID=A0A840NZI4_9ACTN|nr:hypothetical protein [Thermocatellispora tengchongensis]MBB5130570.1 negative regulator of genetic competence, sporulation and motility [Thermocatellispora tengchongensis]